MMCVSVLAMFVGCESNITDVNTPVKASQIGGYIDSSMTWTADMSPYIVNSPVIVDSQATLIIESGVEIRFEWKMGIAIFGSMIAEGTPDSMIRFSAVDGVWSGLVFSGGTADTLSSLSYCIIEYCNAAVLCDSLTSLSVEHCTIQDFTNVGIYVGYRAHGQIVDNDILNLTLGGDPTGIQCDPYAFGMLYGNRITGQARGTLCRYASFTIIDSNYIADCDTGASFFYTYNTVTFRNSDLESRFSLNMNLLDADRIHGPNESPDDVDLLVVVEHGSVGDQPPNVFSGRWVGDDSDGLQWACLSG